MLRRQFYDDKNFELLGVAEEGDIERVRRLIEDPTVDINFIRIVGLGRQSALTIAIDNDHWDLALLLLSKGALSDAPSGVLYDIGYKTVLGFALERILYSNTNTSIILLKALLRQTKDIHTGDLICGKKNSISEILKSNHNAYNYELCASLYLNEIVVRADMNAIESFFASNPSFVMTTASFREYLQGYDGKANWIKSVSKSLNFLVERGKISTSTCHDMKETLVENTSSCNLTLQIKELQQQVTEKDKKIAQLTAELAALKSDKSREEYNPRWFKTMSF